MKIPAIIENFFIWEILLTIGIFIIGIFVGRGISKLLGILANKIDLDKKMKPSFINLILTLIRWSIYIIFFNLALEQLPWPELTRTLTKTLTVIPSFVGSIILISFGFVVAKYLKATIEEANGEWKFLSNSLFYFIILISGIYALRISLFILEQTVLDYIIIMFSTAATISILYHKIRNPNS